jgi:hypothetical protein
MYINELAVKLARSSSIQQSSYLAMKIAVYQSKAFTHLSSGFRRARGLTKRLMGEAARW